MAKEVLTHSDRYVRKTNRIILIVGIITLLVFLFGLMLLTTDTPEEEQHYEVEDTIDAESDLGMGNNTTNNEAEIEFDDAEQVERPITLTPNPINMGQVVLGNDATNVLTIGTNGKGAIRIISVDLEDAAFEGFKFENNCNDKELRGKITCTVTMRWLPTVAANVQNNFKITWRETNVSDSNAKHDEVPVYGNAVRKEDCNFCDSSGSAGIGGAASAQGDLQTSGQVKYAVGPDGKIIGVIGEDGIVRDANGLEIGRVNADGMVVDKDGNIIGVASTGKLVVDANGTVSGYVDAAGVAHDADGKVIGNMLSDGTIIGDGGKVIGKAVSTGYVYDSNGNIIGRVLEDGSVVDLDGNVIGKVDENGNVVDRNGNIIGNVAKSGEMALDENGNRLGIVMPNGEVVNENGDVVGYVDENGNVFQKQKVGTRGSTAQIVKNAAGEVMGYVDENGKVRDFEGNIVGKVDKNGNVVDTNGVITGKVSDEWHDLALDENQNVIGFIDEDGVVRNNGDVVGYVDESGNVIGDRMVTETIGKAGAERKLAYDAGGNVIGYVENDGNVHDFNGNIVGKMDKNGKITDLAGNIIGKVGATQRLAYDADGNVIGYVDDDGTVRDFDGNVIGRMDASGNVVDANGNIIGQLGKTQRLALDKNGRVIGKIDKDGNVHDFNGNEIGKVDSSGNIVDETGSIIGQSGEARRLAYDDNGNAMAYVEDDGTVRDFSGSVTGRLDENGNITDANGNIVGQLGESSSLARDSQGNVIGYVEDSKVRDAEGNEIGRMDDSGNVLDLDGNLIGQVGTSQRLAQDEDGNVIGYIDSNDTVHDISGNIIGRVDKNGNVLQTVKDAVEHPVAGAKGEEMQLALDKDGKVIGYIDENNQVVDFNGGTIGRYDDNGNIIDEAGNIIGSAGEKANLALDKNGNVMGWVNKKNVAFDKNGKIMGIVDRENNIRVFGAKKVGSLLDKQLLPITPSGKVLGEINNRGEVVSQNKVVGKVRPNGLITDKSGAKILARGLHPGYIAGWGCNYENKLDKDGVIRKDGAETGLQIFADGTVWSEDDKFVGKIIETGSVYDDECNYIGEANADGYVRDSYGKEVGCINPDGSVLSLEKPQIKGHLLRQRSVMSLTWQDMGVLEKNGTLRGKQGEVIGCVNHNGEVYDKDMGYLGKISDAYYAYDFNGKLLGVFDKNGKVSIQGQGGVRPFLHNLLAGRNNKVIGFAAPEVNILVDAEGNILGHLFPDGNVYNKSGEIVDRVKGVGLGLYGGTPAKFLKTGYAVDMDGQILGYVNYDMDIVDIKGSVVGKTDAKGRFFDETGRQLGGIVRQGGVRGYNGSYLGYVVATGEVVELDEKSEDADGNQYQRGDVTGNVVPDGHVVKDGRVIGEVLPETIMVDLFGNYVGYSDAFGTVLGADNSGIAALLPGGVTGNNISALPKGFVIDFGGNVIGWILPDGRFMNTQKNIAGYVMADGKVVSYEGKILGEVVSGDIVIGNDDKVKGFVGFDGKIYRSGNTIGRLLTDGLAADNQNNILGHVYNIGNTVLSNNGDYIGRLAANGKVIEDKNKEIGYMKSNGSFIDADKNVSGYLLPEVAKNRWN